MLHSHNFAYPGKVTKEKSFFCYSKAYLSLIKAELKFLSSQLMLHHKVMNTSQPTTAVQHKCDVTPLSRGFQLLLESVTRLTVPLDMAIAFVYGNLQLQTWDLLPESSTAFG